MNFVLTHNLKLGDIMPSSGQTSKTVLKNAASILGMTDYGLDVWLQDDPKEKRKIIKSMAASLVNQAPNKVAAELKAEAAKARRVAAKTERLDRIGFDPRDGGKVGKEVIPRQDPTKSID